MPPSVKLLNAYNGLEGGGLSGAVVADKAVDLSRGNMQGQIVHRLLVPEAFG